MPSITVVSALAVETRGLRRRLAIEQSVHSTPLHVWRGVHQPSGTRVLVVSTGMGETNVRHALGHLRNQIAETKALIVVGSCGALAQSVKLYQQVLPRRLFNDGGLKLLLSSSLVETLANTAPPKVDFADYDLLTVNEVVSTPQLKAELHKRTGAAVVDMEAYILADFCHGINLDVAVLKGVIDTAAESIPTPDAPPVPDAVPFDELMRRIEEVSHTQADWLETLFETL